MRLFLPFPVRRQVSRVTARALSPAGVVIAACAMLAASWALSGWLLYQARVDVYQRAVEHARNLMRIIERDVARNIELYDLSLQAAAEGVSEPEVMALPQSLRDRILFDRVAPGEYLSSLFLLDGQGGPMAASGPLPPWAANAAGRHFFAVHRDGRAQGLYIGWPAAVPGGSKTMVLSRRVARPEGGFGGVAAGVLSVDYFRGLLEGLEVGEHGTAALALADGTLITRLPYDAGVVGRDLRDSPVFSRMLVNREGVIHERAAIDGIRRIYAYRQLDRLPIIVSVAPADSDVYAGWLRRAERLCLLVAACSVIVLAGAFLLARELRRRQRAEEALHRLARTDALTGLDNRGTFNETLRREWRRAAPVPAVRGRGLVQGLQRLLRAPGGRRRAEIGRAAYPGLPAAARRPGGALRRRGVRGHAARRRRGPCRADGRGDTRGRGGAGHRPRAQRLRPRDGQHRRGDLRRSRHGRGRPGRRGRRGAVPGQARRARPRLRGAGGVTGPAGLSPARPASRAAVR